MLPNHKYPIPQREPLIGIIRNRCIPKMTDDCEETDDPLYADRRELSPVGALLGGQSLKCVGVNFSCTAADVTATLAASMTLPADADDNACEAPAA